MAKSPKVVDFSTHFSGPVAARWLTHLGADVIKVEHPVVGDGNRKFGPMFHEDSVHHLYLNAGTRSLAMAWQSPEWPRTVQALANWADVVIVGNRPAQAERLGIDAAAMLGHNPALVYCMITGYGLDGEWAALPAHGLNMDALAGAVLLKRDDGDLRVSHRYRSVGTTVAGIEAALGIYAALHRRAQGQGGQVVQVSIWEAALAWQWRDLVTQANLGHAWTEYQDLGSRYAVYTTQDDKALLVCPIEQRFWEQFCDVLGLPADIKARGDWSGGMDLGADYRSLGESQLIAGVIRTRPQSVWLERLRAAQVPVSPVLDYTEAMASAHAQANGVMGSYQIHGHTASMPVPPVSITPVDSGVDGATLAASHRAKSECVPRPPDLGEHNREILMELGLEP
ncbi:CaiB/BaiF CoA-transferase family protein [Bordetella sp. BOR01]|uniref:CaiB/BaiF CoA transferase family protein n=1 Tax=Bordetella sp. BOR01 TaxID=2854779 RepID=UPI001C4430BF|nr:CaiB/BaiF CoA-transferase family protein [Bordetella sp. BOR01]MBV7482175.1 CoA transferase [Bordetella sp. BOR01]